MRSVVYSISERAFAQTAIYIPSASPLSLNNRTKKVVAKAKIPQDTPPDAGITKLYLAYLLALFSIVLASKYTIGQAAQHIEIHGLTALKAPFAQSVTDDGRIQEGFHSEPYGLAAQQQRGVENPRRPDCTT